MHQAIAVVVNVISQLTASSFDVFYEHKLVNNIGTYCVTLPLSEHTDTQCKYVLFLWGVILQLLLVLALLLVCSVRGSVSVSVRICVRGSVSGSVSSSVSGIITSISIMISIRTSISISM